MVILRSGETGQYLYFVAVDSADLKTRKTALSSFTVYRARGGGAATAMTTPTVAEVSAANMPGVYTLLLDEDTTIASGKPYEIMTYHITQASMAAVTITALLENKACNLAPLVSMVCKASTSGYIAYVHATNRADGTPKTGLVYNTAGLSASYIRAGAARSALSLVSQTTTGAYADSAGFVEMDSTNMPGVYRLDIPTAVIASGVKAARITFLLADVDITPIHLDITAYDPNAAGADATTVAAAVWDEALAGHTTAGTSGKTLSDASTNISTIQGQTTTSGVVVASIAANAITATAIASSAITSAKIATSALTSSAFAAGAITNSAFAAGAIAASTFAAGAVDSTALNATATAAIADKILGRNLATGSDGGRDVKSALRSLRNKITKTAGTVTVYAEDDLTSAWTATYTTASEDPVATIDPA